MLAFYTKARSEILDVQVSSVLYTDPGLHLVLNIVPIVSLDFPVVGRCLAGSVFFFMLTTYVDQFCEGVALWVLIERL
jgi:hypothetical protein